MNFIYLLIEKRTQAPLYVGKTVNLEGRFGSHSKHWIERHGLEIEMIVLEECDRSWQEAEIEWIAFFRSFCKIENKMSGGNAFPESTIELAVKNSHTKESRRKAENTKRIRGTTGKFSQSAIKNAQSAESKHKRIQTAKNSGGMKKSISSMFTDESKAKRIESMRQNQSFGKNGVSLSKTNDEKRFISGFLNVSFNEAGEIRQIRKRLKE